MERRPNLLRAALILSMAGAAFLAVVLLVFLGAITQRFPGARLIRLLPERYAESIESSGLTWFLLSGDRYSLGSVFSATDVVVLSAIAVSTLLVVVGVTAVYMKADPAAVDFRPSPWPVYLIGVSAAFTTAALAATALEVAGLWKSLAPDPDPLMEKGAPVWVWWILFLISSLPWLVPGGRRRWALDRGILIRRTSIATLAGLVIFSVATSLHAVRADPVQGRYHGIPGFTVGRQFSNEYGTYYGTTGGAAASILGFSALIGIFHRSKERHQTG